ncbi:MAG: TylF/MycF family methyltransferase [Nitrospira sp.]|nr:TylF/MycF family methyltransferase [Nitrospira sp.]
MKDSEKTSSAIKRAGMHDIEDSLFRELVDRCSPYCLLTPEKFYDLYGAVNYICDRGVRGDIVECGVGRAVLMIADLLARRGDVGRSLFLYDTFQGFVERSAIDVTHGGRDVGRVRYPDFL